MKTLRLLNIVALLLIFTPFFQMCSDNPTPEKSETPVLDLLSAQNIASDSLSLSSSESDSLALPPQDVQDDGMEKANIAEKFWELITFPGEHFTATAFGLLVLSIFEILDGNPSEIWVGTIFTNCSIFLTIFTLTRLIKSRNKRLSLLLLINIVFILAAFGSAVLTLDSVHQIKWGFYSYLAATILLLVLARRVVPLPESPPSLAT
jgi:hypothetical protein